VGFAREAITNDYKDISMKKIGYLAVAVIAFLLLGAGYLYWKAAPGPSGLTSVRITFTPYPDTSLFYYGLQKGFFRDEGLDLQIKDLTWNEQIEFTAGDGTDIAMATLDEVVAKSRNLTQVGKPVVYFLPAWLFEGTIFACRSDMQTLPELRANHDDATAKKLFLQQLKGKIIAVPESGLYDNAIRQLILSAGEKTEDFQFVNTQLETGINGLRDNKVGIAAAGAFERPEALRRGYKIALDSVDLNVLVITGFISSKKYYDENPRVIDAFTRAWYRTVNEALKNPEESYNVVKTHLNETGSKPVSLDDYKAALAGNRFPKSPQEASEMFFSSTSPIFWRKAWDGAVSTLQKTGKADQVPADTVDFRAEAVNARLKAVESH
jgi:ABC-type nitrate/sulfonate/bicarbonate transport system substrate-binding protein